MKKEYKTPAMKVRTMVCSHMLCGSTFGINSEGVDEEDATYSSYEGYGDAW